MLQLLSFLQTHRYWPGHELAEQLEISPRTLRRDVDRLRDLGYPVDADRGVGGYQLAAGAALPTLVIDDEEAVAIAVGLQAAAQGAITGIEESALQALAKVVQVMPPRLGLALAAWVILDSPILTLSDDEIQVTRRGQVERVIERSQVDAVYRRGPKVLMETAAGRKLFEDEIEGDAAVIRDAFVERGLPWEGPRD